MENTNKLDDQLAKVIEKSLEIAERTGEFVIDQAPDLLREFYTWHIMKSCIWLFVGVLLIILLFKVSNTFGCNNEDKSEHSNYKKLFGRNFPEDKWGDVKSISYFLTFRISGAIIGGLFIVSNTLSLIKLIVAPKIYLIEYFINH